MENILVISGGLQIGGAERVAANISKYAPMGEFCFHYLVFEGNDNDYGDEIIEKGGKVFTLPSPGKNYSEYIKSLGSLIDKYKYKAVHSHTMFNSGINLAVAKLKKVPVRIAHSHTTKTETHVSKAQKAYEMLMRRLILRCATDLLSCGEEAGKWLYGEKNYYKRCHLINNGIDIEENSFNEDLRDTIRKSMQLENKYVIGHVGSLMNVKNQQYLIKLMPDILKEKPEAVLLLLGGGENEGYLRNLIKDLDLEQYVILYGSTTNVHELLNVFDVFAFPSLREGTPLALLEAQTNGIPCVVSSNVPDDAFLTDLVSVVDLEDSDKWIRTICSGQRSNPSLYSSLMSKSGYNAEAAYQLIYDIYRR